LLIFSGWNTTVVPPNNNQDATFIDAYSYFHSHFYR
jgi:hypothetical protein